MNHDLKWTLVTFGMFIIIVMLAASYISRVNIFWQNEKRTRLERCLTQGIGFEKCYAGVYQYENFLKTQ